MEFYPDPQKPERKLSQRLRAAGERLSSLMLRGLIASTERFDHASEAVSGMRSRKKQRMLVNSARNDIENFCNGGYGIKTGSGKEYKPVVLGTLEESSTRLAQDIYKSFYLESLPDSGWEMSSERIGEVVFRKRTPLPERSGIDLVEAIIFRGPESGVGKTHAGHAFVVEREAFPEPAWADDSKSSS